MANVYILRDNGAIHNKVLQYLTQWTMTSENVLVVNGEPV